MRAWSLSAKLCLGLSLLSFSSVADAQVKPRFVIGVDTSGSMRSTMSSNPVETNGDGVGRPPAAGDSASLILNGVYYGCGNNTGARPRTGAGADQGDADCLPNESRIWIAKDAISKMIYAFGDVEWALSRFKQTQALNAETNSNYGVTSSCGGAEGGCSGGYNNLNYTGRCCNSSCNPVLSGDGEMLVGFPGIAGQAFATKDNRAAILRWMDNVETGFHTPTAADVTNVDLCDHANGNDCELRIPRNGSFTPIGGLIRDSGAYATATRSGDASKTCRQYSVILVTDGADTCASNPNQEAFKLAWPAQAAMGNCNPASLPTIAPDIKTYVVGISLTAADVTSLNQIAACGGTGNAFLANSPAQLSAALSNIVAGSIKFESCNGLDDDCDGAIDEDLPRGQPSKGNAADQSQALFCDGEAHRTSGQNDQVRLRGGAYGALSTTTPYTPILRTIAPNLNPDQVVCGPVKDDCTRPGEDDDCDGAIDEDGTFNSCGFCPGAVDTCGDGIDNDCDGVVDNLPGNSTPFSACPTQCTADVPCGSNVGECKLGKYVCDQTTHTLSTTCTGGTGPAMEICDQKDNNCNGIVDDPQVLSRTCSINPSYVVGGSSICRPGTQICAAGNEPKDAMGYHVDSSGAPVCVGQVLPDDRELCDAQDHDCNGNNYTCTQATCTVGPQPAFVGNPCGSGVGICVGTLQCDQSMNKLVCNAPSPATETCNNIDDNCDGAVDNAAVAGNDLGGVSGGPSNGFCGTEMRMVGVCSPGHFQCTNGHWQCLGEHGPSLEVCNNLDDNCNGATDELSAVTMNDPRIGQKCGTSVGECKPGLSVCSAGGVITCTPVQGPVPEVCDGKDNDCDNLIDENLPDNNNDDVRDIVLCGSSVGLCKPGQQTCVALGGGAYGYQCIGGVGPVPEICDGLDNNCDGNTDECTGATSSAAYMACQNDPNGPLGAGGGEVCGNPVAPCHTGKTKCVANADGQGHPGFICVGNVNGGPELCNLIDDDCDTKIDEDLDPRADPRLGQTCGQASVGTCTDGQGHPCGQCRLGTNQCIGGAIQCIGSVGPAPYEKCNNADDDCDNKIDECVDPNGSNCSDGKIDPNTPVGTPCGDDTGACMQGANACVNGALVCENFKGPTDEICNAIDDDCDTLIDENIPTGAPCGSSVGECQPGVLVCPPGGTGALICQGDVKPINELCDGLDNDCDGMVDEGLGLGEPCGSDVGTCKPGKLACIGGRTVCSGEVGPQPETCDCMDNDCDGKTDEDTGSNPVCPGTAACIMCQCALPCAPHVEFAAQCPNGKAPIVDANGCFCVGEQCKPADCQSQTIMAGGEVQCAPKSDKVGSCFCKNNVCTSRCAGVTCDSGLVCDPTDGRCKQPSCLQAQFACASDKTCTLADNVWQCVDDPCSTAKCAAEEVCRDGNCYKSCAAVICGNGNRCKDGTCVADHCSGVNCDPGLICNPADGKCVVAGACVSTGCPDGQTCDKVKGACTQDTCLATHCPYGQKCNSDTGQCELRCSGSLLFCDTMCVNPQTSRTNCGATGDCQGQNAGMACPSAQVCSQGKCSNTCANNTLNCNGECIDPHTDMRHCGAKTDCKGTHVGETCQVGFNCVDSACVPISSAGGTGAKATKPDGTRVVAKGGGGCACSVGVGAVQQRAQSSRRGALSMLLLALGLAWLGRRRRARLPWLLARSSWLVLVVAMGATLLGSGCKVDTFCLDCPTAGKGGSIKQDSGIGGGRVDSGMNVVTDSGHPDAAPPPDATIVDATTKKPDGGCTKVELCNGLDDDCDGKTDEDVDLAASNIDPKTDPNNCGGCGSVCMLAHAFNNCTAGSCGIDKAQGAQGCDIGYYNLDGDDSNGCEYRCTKTADNDTLCDLVDNDCDGKVDEDVDLNTDPENCGRCSFRCSFAHAKDAGKCVDKVCVLDDTKCDTGFANVDAKEPNGCEYRCPVQPAIAEVCNGLDDDCDGTTDEEVTTATDNRIGIACGKNVGVCKPGMVVCMAGQPVCMGGTGPSQEVCDGLDNNCDGNVDIDDPNFGLPCGDPQVGSQCSKGTLQIPVSGCSGGVVKPLECLGGQGPVDEICNGLDDDCDGQADEAENGVKPGEGQKCLNGSSGVQVVTSDPAQWTAATLCKTGLTVCESGTLSCRGEIAPEAVELCDDKDHDCDGDPLNGFTPDVSGGTTATRGPDARVGKNCGIDTGECAFGVQTCHLATKSLSCDNQILPAPETCDGKDNDCNGLIDDRQKNSSNQDIPLPGEAAACITNGNGTVNTNPPASASTGICRTGLTVCSAGKIGCQGEVSPQLELCDAIDQDCDGDPTNGVAATDPAVGKPCGPPNVGVCKTGVTVCSSGANPTVSCQGALPSATYAAPAATNTPEAACDGIDNDCDGATDEGSPAAYDGASCCDLGGGFMCCPGSSGTRQCANGRIQCVYPNNAVFPVPEACGDVPGGNGADDDCDGTIDEGFNVSTDVNNCGSCNNKCQFNSGTTMPNAVLVCSTGACKIGACSDGYVDANHDYHDGCEKQCTVTGNEICDGKDNDCNGLIDDLATIPSVACVSKQTGVCAATQAAINALMTYGPSCTGGVLGCNVQNAVNNSGGAIANYEATESLCDGKDNDCNGKTDEMMAPPVGQACSKGQGACKTNGSYACDQSNATSKVSICNAATPPSGTTETCNGADDDCDGRVDDFGPPKPGNSVGNFDYVDLGASTGHTLVMAYEASRPDANGSSGGARTSKACAVDKVVPWANVTWDEARAACCALNTAVDVDPSSSPAACDPAGGGWRLCDSSTTNYVCKHPDAANPAAPAAGCTWGYSNNATLAVCDHAASSTTYQNACLGSEALVAGKVTCPAGVSQCGTVTGSTVFPECRSPWADGDVHDLSGNLQEWTNTSQGANTYEIRGGSYNDLEGGRTCDFNFTVGANTFRFPNTGFRCCWYPTPTTTCTTYDSGVTAAAPVNAGANTGDTVSTLTVPATTGKISSVQLLDTSGNHQTFDDLTFTLASPAGTSVQLVPPGDCCGAGGCSTPSTNGSIANWAFDLADSATNAVPNGANTNPFCNNNAAPAGGNINNAYKPTNAFVTFNGQASPGTWTLTINDNRNGPGSAVGGDKVQLTGWKLRICTDVTPAP
jgi:hypothetical protein